MGLTTSGDTWATTHYNTQACHLFATCFAIETLLNDD